jgi:hypothetical protein
MSWESFMPMGIQNCFSKRGFGNIDEANAVDEQVGGISRPRILNILNADKLIPTTDDQKTSLHVATEKKLGRKCIHFQCTQLAKMH